MSVLTSKVIQTPRLLGGRTGDYKENVHFQCTEGPEILQGASLMIIQVILDVQSPFRNQECHPRLLDERSGDGDY